MIKRKSINSIKQTTDRIFADKRSRWKNSLNPGGELPIGKELISKAYLASSTIGSYGQLPDLTFA